MARMKSEEARKYLAHVPEENSFYCTNGSYITSIEELGTAMEKIDDQIYYYHAHDHGNDFSKWVGDVIGDQKLSRDLDKASSKTEASKRTQERITFLQSRL